MSEQLRSLVIEAMSERRGERKKRTVAIDDGDFAALEAQASELSTGSWQKYEPADIIRGLVRQHNDAVAKAKRAPVETAIAKQKAKRATRPPVKVARDPNPKARPRRGR